MMIYKKSLLITIGLISIGCLAYWLSMQTEEETKKVFVTKVKKQSITNSFTVSGALVFRRDIELKSEVTGKINEVLVKDGQSVSKGDILLRIDPEISQSEVDRAEASVQIEKINIERQELEISNTVKQWERKKQLFGKGLINKEEFDNLSNQLGAAKLNLKSSEGSLLRVQAELNKAEDNLQKTIVRSPMDGIVTNVAMNVGETAYAGGQTGSGSLLMRVANPSEVLAEVNIDERDISKVKVGQVANIKVVAFSRRKLSGTIESIATAAKSNDSYQGGLNFQAKILLHKTPDLEEQFEGFRSGMTCQAEIKTLDKPDVLTIPSESIQYNLSLEQTIMSERTANDIAYVFVAENGLVKKRKVRLGISNDSSQEVIAGISIGEKIVIGPYNIFQSLKHDEAVEIGSNEKPRMEMQDMEAIEYANDQGIEIAF